MTASIEKLAPIRQINGLENSRKTESVIEEAAGSFGNIFTSAVENVLKLMMKRPSWSISFP